jgi:hypothetical protein
MRRPTTTATFPVLPVAHAGHIHPAGATLLPLGLRTRVRTGRGHRLRHQPFQQAVTQPGHGTYHENPFRSARFADRSHRFAPHFRISLVRLSPQVDAPHVNALTECCKRPQLHCGEASWQHHARSERSIIVMPAITSDEYELRLPITGADIRYASHILDVHRPEQRPDDMVCSSDRSEHPCKLYRWAMRVLDTSRLNHHQH